MWIRTGAFALLSVRRVQGVGFGFWPSLREWKIGALFFLLMLPVVAALAWWIGYGKFHPPEASWIRTPVIVVLYFFGGLWVLSLGEEFFFRGLLQQWMIGWLRNEWAGLIATSLLFGAVHLPYGSFPNWRFALLAAVAGVFYGLAFRQASSIRASMVTTRSRSPPCGSSSLRSSLHPPDRPKRQGGKTVAWPRSIPSEPASFRVPRLRLP